MKPPTQAHLMRLMRRNPLVMAPTMYGLREQEVFAARDHLMYGVNPLLELSDALNLNEILAFSAGSWSWRVRDPEGVNGFLKGARSLYDIFSEVNRQPLSTGRTWWQERSAAADDSYNEHARSSFRERLTEADWQGVLSFVMKEALRMPVDRYLRGDEEYRSARDYALHVDGSDDHVVFLIGYPAGRAPRTLPNAYAKDIQRLLNPYYQNR